jgi:isoleucyl-tRNA synthetase
MHRELDLIDVWFDSGSMPYAQWHYPFENKEQFERNFPADFIAEGVDQTRGWFYTLHAISTMVFDKVAFKNVVSNGLVLDKEGVKMSKRLNNGVDPFEAIGKHGADANRWYMMSNSNPWDNLKYDDAGVMEVRNKFFGTLFNTYKFFSGYANIDGFKYAEKNVPLENRPEIDRWVLSLLNSLIKEVNEDYANYDVTPAARKIQTFVVDHLSNWYVRLCRRRFWKGEYTEDKIAAYQTLYICMETVAKLMAPVAPFFSDYLYQNLNEVTKRETHNSIHLSLFPSEDKKMIDKDLEERMDYAQRICSLVLSLRKKENLRVRQPLQKVMLPVLDQSFMAQVEGVKDLILSEVNVKEIEYLTEESGVIKKSIKANFKTLGRRLGKNMKAAVQAINQFTEADIANLEKMGKFDLDVDGTNYELTLEDFEIKAEDVPGLLVANDGALTVALDTNLDDALLAEGMARELVNRIQNIRKNADFNVTDRIKVQLEKHEAMETAIAQFGAYIQEEVLADELTLVDGLSTGEQMELPDEVTAWVEVKLS